MSSTVHYSEYCIMKALRKHRLSTVPIVSIAVSSGGSYTSRLLISFLNLPQIPNSGLII